MTKLTLGAITDTTSPVEMNSNFDAIETFTDSVLSRTGTSPNQMEAVLDMNSNDIINAATGRFQSLWLNGVQIVPDGVTEVSGGGGGGDGLQFYDTKSAAAADAANLTNNDIVYIAGATSSGDGGGGTYRYTDGDISTQVASDTQAGLYIADSADATGASGGFILLQDGWNVNPINFGVTPDTGDVATEFNAMLVALSTRYGFAHIKLAEGTYTLNMTSLKGLDITQNHIWIEGSGRRGTILKHGTGDGHTISIDTVTGGGLSNLQIDGGRGISTVSAHNIRIDDVTDYFLYDLRVENAEAYGIGIQDGTNESIRLDMIEIDSCGHDGIDIKNKNDDNTVGFMSNIDVRQVGMDSTGKAAIDLRGPWHLNNIHVSNLNASTTGVRFREGEAVDVNGVGAHNTVMTNFYIAGTGSNTGRIGISGNVYQLNCTGGIIRNIENGIVAGVNDKQMYTDILLENCDDAIFSSTNGNYFDNCRVINCSDTALRLDGNQNIVNNCELNGAVESVRIPNAGNANNEINYCKVPNTITDNGTANTFDWCLPASVNTGTSAGVGGATQNITHIRRTHGSTTSNLVISGLSYMPTWIKIHAVADTGAGLSASSEGFVAGTGSSGETACWQYSGASNRQSGRIEDASVYITDGTNNTKMSLDVWQTDGFELQVHSNSFGNVELLMICGDGSVTSA